MASFNSSSITVFSSSTTDQLCSFGTEGSGDGEFGSLVPGLLVNSFNGNIIATDVENDRIQVLDEHGAFVRKFSVEAPGRLAWAPTCRSIFVTASQTQPCIKEFNLFGRLIREIRPSVLGFPSGIAIDVNGELLVADYAKHNILRVGADGTLLRTIGTKGSGDGNLDRPMGVAVDGLTGHIFVTDMNNNCVKIFSSEGDFLHKIPISSPSAIELDPFHQRMLIAESASNSIQIFE